MDRLIKRCNFVMVMALVAGLAMGCAKKPDKSRIVAEINNYQVTIDDFRQKARMTAPNMLLESNAEKVKGQVMEDIINEELLLQEAQKMKLDKDKGFMREIENYWKQALIKSLAVKKGEEFLAASEVSDEEIKAEYDSMSKEWQAASGPHGQAVAQIRERLRMKKARDAFERWNAGLKNSAVIKKREDVLKGVKIGTSESGNGGVYEE